MLNTEQFKKVIKKGFDQNIVVYDVGAPKQTLTARLLILMTDICLRNFEDAPFEFYVPSEASRTFEENLVYNLDELNKDGELLNYYLNELKGSLAKYPKGNNDEYLVVGVGENVVILGSF